MANVNKVTIRMYRLGTGDFFHLQFKNGNKVKFNLVIDCGCINGTKKDFTVSVNHLKGQVKGSIDLLVVTHEHADHINGFELAADAFKNIDIKEAWFAWTEANTKFANDFRREHSKVSLAIASAAKDLRKLKLSGEFERLYENQHNSALKIEARNHFVNVLNGLDQLNFRQHTLAAKSIPTMEDILKNHNVIKSSTKVKFRSPGDVIEDIKGLEGIRFFVLGPPKDNDWLKKKEVKDEGYEKREKPSKFNMSFVNLAARDSLSAGSEMPFDKEYESSGTDDLQKSYKDIKNKWRSIDTDWLLSAGNLALKHETCINNTSLAMAMQFTDSEKILLFPGDAEHGNWLSWHQKGMKWKFKESGKIKEVNAEYILNNTVFYKVGHHLSQNGTAKKQGLEMMTSDELSAMATLDFSKIMSGWKNTMPNDFIGELLLDKTKGKLFFAGDRDRILKNIDTDRVTLNNAFRKELERLNKKFDGNLFVEHSVSG